MEYRWLYLTCLGLLMAVIAAATVRTGQLLRRWTPPFNPLLSMPENALRLGLVGLCGALGLWLGPEPRVLGWLTDFLAQDLAIGVAAGILLAAVLSLLGRGAQRVWGPAIHDDRLLRAILPENPREWVGVTAALFPAALLEELLFRSLPLGGLSWLMEPSLLLWPLSLFFGILHWPQGGWGIAGTTIAAAALSLLFLATGSIWAPLSAHYTMNVLQIVLATRSGLRPTRSAASD